MKLIALETKHDGVVLVNPDHIVSARWIPELSATRLQLSDNEPLMIRLPLRELLDVIANPEDKPFDWGALQRLRRASP